MLDSEFLTICTGEQEVSTALRQMLSLTKKEYTSRQLAVTTHHKKECTKIIEAVAQLLPQLPHPDRLIGVMTLLGEFRDEVHYTFAFGEHIAWLLHYCMLSDDPVLYTWSIRAFHQQPNLYRLCHSVLHDTEHAERLYELCERWISLHDDAHSNLQESLFAYAVPILVYEDLAQSRPRLLDSSVALCELDDVLWKLLSGECDVAAAVTDLTRIMSISLPRACLDAIEVRLGIASAWDRTLVWPVMGQLQLIMGNKLSLDRIYCVSETTCSARSIKVFLSQLEQYSPDAKVSDDMKHTSWTIEQVRSRLLQAHCLYLSGSCLWRKQDYPQKLCIGVMFPSVLLQFVRLSEIPFTAHWTPHMLWSLWLTGLCATETNVMSVASFQRDCNSLQPLFPSWMVTRRDLTLCTVQTLRVIHSFSWAQRADLWGEVGLFTRVMLSFLRVCHQYFSHELSQPSDLSRTMTNMATAVSPLILLKEEVCLRKVFSILLGKDESSRLREFYEPALVILQNRLANITLSAAPDRCDRRST